MLRGAVDAVGILPDQFKKELAERGGEKILHELIHDATEKKIPQPDDPKVQANFYSEKRRSI